MSFWAKIASPPDCRNLYDKYHFCFKLWMSKKWEEDEFGNMDNHKCRDEFEDWKICTKVILLIVRRALL